MASVLVGLWAAIAALGQIPDDLPDAIKHKIEAAANADDSGDHQKAEALLLQAVKEAEKLGELSLPLASSLECLGGFYADPKRKRFTEGERQLRRALAIREKTQGPAHQDIARVLVLLSTCRMGPDNQQAGSARALLQRAMRIVEKSGTTDDRMIVPVRLAREVGRCDSKLTAESPDARL
jgi:hypothetical protein